MGTRDRQRQAPQPRQIHKVLELAGTTHHGTALDSTELDGTKLDGTTAVGFCPGRRHLPDVHAALVCAGRPRDDCCAPACMCACERAGRTVCAGSRKLDPARYWHYEAHTAV